MVDAVRIFVPRDTTALSLGADAVAAAFEREAAARKLEVEVLRNGSRGLCWLEPLVEVETADGRIAYGPVASDDVAGLLDAGLTAGAAAGHHSSTIRCGVMPVGVPHRRK